MSTHFIGERIHNLRIAKGLTLTELSKLSGVQLATLSRIEKCKMIGTVETHDKIAYILGIELSDLYDNIGVQYKSPEFFAADNKVINALRKDKVADQLLIHDAPHKKMLPSLAIIQPQSQSSVEKTKLRKDEFIYMLKGTIAAIVGDQTFDLKSGDAFYFDASVSHYFKNTGSTEAQFIKVREQ